MLESMMFEEDHHFLIEIDSDLGSVLEWEHYLDTTMLLMGSDSTILPAALSGSADDPALEALTNVEGAD